MTLMAVLKGSTGYWYQIRRCDNQIGLLSLSPCGMDVPVQGCFGPLSRP